MSNADDLRDANPWRPMTRPIDLKHLGKLSEELNEAGSAVARCIIQGVDESEPVTGKPNRVWLEDELADVIANVELVTRHFRLDRQRMKSRADRKMAHLGQWHSMLDGVEPALLALGKIVKFANECSDPQGWLAINVRSTAEPLIDVQRGKAGR